MTDTMLAVIVGVGVRLLVPITLTALVVYFLHRMDVKWAEEAEEQLIEARGNAVSQTPCWETKGCSPEARRACKASSGKEPCWQAFRTRNGLLQDQCLDCEVFLGAPVPLRVLPHDAHAHQPK